MPPNLPSLNSASDFIVFKTELLLIWSPWQPEFLIEVTTTKQEVRPTSQQGKSPLLAS